MKIFKALLIILIGSLFGCVQDDDDNLKLSAYSCVLDEENAYEIIEINNGSGDYTVKASSENIVHTKIKGNRICIEGSYIIGDVVVTIIDNKDQRTANIKVRVNYQFPISLYDGTFLKKGDVVDLPYEYDVSRYELSNSDETVAKVQVRDKKLHIEALETGATYIDAKDYGLHSVFLLKIMVIDSYPLLVGRLEPELVITRRLSDTSNHVFDIKRGNGEYIIESSDESIATAHIIPYTEEIDPYIDRNPVTVRISAKKVGDVSFTITDIRSNSKINVPFKFVL